MLFDKIRYTGCAFGEYSANNTTLYDTHSIILYLLYFQEKVIVRVVLFINKHHKMAFFLAFRVFFLFLSISLPLFFHFISIYAVNIPMFKYTLRCIVT